MKRLSKTDIKIDLRDKGIEVKPSRFLSSTQVVLSFSLPIPVMNKLKSLKTKYPKRRDMVEHLLKSFDFDKCKIIETWYSDSFSEYIKSNKIKLSKEYSHDEYLTSSMIVTPTQYETISNISRYYNISKSSFLRVLIESI
jgi:hypothetical protein